jgi:CubicO group peptidase (beta-lactamase class C family)
MRLASFEIVGRLLCAAISTRVASAQQDPRAALVVRLDSIATSALPVEHLPGLSLAVVRGTDTLLAKGYGYADIGLGVPVTPRTTFRAVGVGTQTIGIGLLQQVEAGRRSAVQHACRSEGAR